MYCHCRARNDISHPFSEDIPTLCSGNPLSRLQHVVLCYALQQNPTFLKSLSYFLCNFQPLASLLISIFYIQTLVLKKQTVWCTKFSSKLFLFEIVHKENFICLPINRENMGKYSTGFSGAPTITSLPWDFNNISNGRIECTAEIVKLA